MTNWQLKHDWLPVALVLMVIGKEGIDWIWFPIDREALELRAATFVN